MRTTSQSLPIAYGGNADIEGESSALVKCSIRSTPSGPSNRSESITSPTTGLQSSRGVHFAQRNRACLSYPRKGSRCRETTDESAADQLVRAQRFITRNERFVASAVIPSV